MIKINNLNKYFYHKKSNEIHVINDASIEFPKTGLVTIVGESGSGKTTLMNVIGGLDDFYSGSIEIDDYKINKYSSRKIDRIRNEKIGYIFQNYLLLSNRTVYDNLKIVLGMYDLSIDEINYRIDYVLESVGMLKYKKKNVNELSGGQQQRVAIARALIKSPALILADEPTGNLDEKNTIQIMNIIKKISEKTLVIMVSHERKIANSYSDYIIEVCDGKVLNNKEIKNNESYKYEDDQNLYLKEYKYNKITSDQIDIDFYSNSSDKINLKVIYENGKYYINSSENIVLVDSDSEVKIIDDHKKILDVAEESFNLDYNLEPVKYSKTPKLSFKEQVKLAFSNLAKAKKQAIILGIPLFIIIVVVLICLQGIISKSKVDRRHLVHFDSRIYTINLEKQAALLNTDGCKFGFEKFYEGFSKALPQIEPVLDSSCGFTFTLPDFEQLKTKKYDIKGFSVISTEQISEDELLYGRLPENANEIVIDKWVLENAIEESTLNNFMNVYSFLNEEVSLLYKPTCIYKIVGISENDENSVYMNKWTIFDLFPSNIKKEGLGICSLSEALKYTDKTYDVKLLDGEFIANIKSRRAQNLTKLKINDDKNITVYYKQTLDFDDCPFDVIVSDEMYDSILLSALKTSYEEFNVFCEDENEIKLVDDYVNSVSEYFKSGELKATSEFGFDESIPIDHKDIEILITTSSKYNNMINPHVEEANRVVTSRLLVTITIVLVSIIIVYFTMRSFAIKNIYDIGVFRALGIKKTSIVFVYALEVVVISLLSTLIGGVLCYAVSNIIGGMPNSDPGIAISFSVFAYATFGLILLNILVGILPVIICLKSTPSQILSKYDI